MSRMGEYFIWLTEQIDDRQCDSDFLYDTCAVLFDITFQPLDADDMNRVGDAHSLQQRYLEEEGLDGLIKNGNEDAYENEEATVLEVLVALCIRLEHDILGEPGNEHPERWFWQMIANFGITEDMDEHDIYQIINDWMDGNYEPDGRGGPFILHDYDYDVRELGLWDQAQHYIFENFSLV